LGSERVVPTLARTLAETLLGDDARYVRSGDGRWTSQGRDLNDARFTVVDVETTGISSQYHRIIEIGAVRVEGFALGETFETLIDTGSHIPSEITAMTGITQDMVDGAPGSEEALTAFCDFLGDTVFVAHNAPFDRGFVYREVRQICGEELTNPVLCTRLLARRAVPELGRYSLDVVAERLGHTIDNRHRGLADALAAAHILVAATQVLMGLGVQTIEQLLRVQRKAEFVKFQRGR
jgi:DNA polymerase III epsilon subunit family exonuclease